MNFIIEHFVPIMLIVVLVLLYVLTYKLNKMTPVPEECKEDIDLAACNTCKNFACSLKG